jgi:hypothetical protein
MGREVPEKGLQGRNTELAGRFPPLAAFFTLVQNTGFYNRKEVV